MPSASECRTCHGFRRIRQVSSQEADYPCWIPQTETDGTGESCDCTRGYTTDALRDLGIEIDHLSELGTAIASDSSRGREFQGIISRMKMLTECKRWLEIWIDLPAGRGRMT